MAGAKGGAGSLTERLTILSSSPVAVAVTSITRSGTTATVTTTAAHGFTTGEYVTHAGAVETDYNIEAAVTVTSTTVYTFTVAGSPTTPATGTITATYVSDSQGGQGTGTHTLATVWGSMRPLSASERLAAAAVQSTQLYEGRIMYRVPQDVTPMMKITWTPYGFASAKTLEIHGVLPDPNDPRRFLVLDIGEVL